MAIRIRYKIEVAVSSTSAEDRDLGNGFYEVVVDSLSEGGSWRVTLGLTAVDEEIPLPQMTSAKFLMIRTTPKDPNAEAGDVVIKLNAADADPITISPLAMKEGHLLLSTSDVSVLYATNTAGVIMDLTMVAGGD